MLRRTLGILGLLLVPLSVPLFPQRPSVQQQKTVDVTIKVVYQNQRSAPLNCRVQILTSSGGTFAEAFTDTQGDARFALPGGTYRLRLTGAEIEETSPVSAFNIYPQENTHTEIVYVNAKADAANPADADAPTVSAAFLKVPEKGRDEYLKGAEAMQKNQVAEAEKHFRKAVEIYPNFADALNSLGVISMQQGKPAEGRELFEKALAADPNFAPTYLNLAKISSGVRDFQKSEDLLNKAVTLNPRSSETLSMLAYIQLSLHQYPEAVATAQRVHLLSHKDFAAVHFVAGRALEAQGQPEQALEEYNTFLQESPTGLSADEARKAVARLSASATQPR